MLFLKGAEGGGLAAVAQLGHKSGAGGGSWSTTLQGRIPPTHPGSSDFWRRAALAGVKAAVERIQGV